MAREAERAKQRAQEVQKPQKLSYKDQRELDQLPERMGKLEEKIAELGATTKTDSFYSQPYEQTQSVLNEIQEATTLLETSMARWVALEEQQQNFLALKKQGR